MSFAAFALRTTVREALKGRTWAGPNVFEISGLIEENGSDVPQLSIMVEIAQVQDRVVTVALQLEIYNRLVIPDPETPRIGWEVPVASAANERVLDVLERQVMRALGADDGWGNVLRELAGTTRPLAKRVVPTPGAEQRRMLLDFAVEHAEPFEEPKAGAWRTFLDEIEASSLAIEMAIAEHMLKPAPETPDWRALGVSCGFTFEEAYEPAPEPKPKKTRKKPRGREAGG